MPETHVDRMSLEELQKFLADELVSPDGVGDFSRAFTPLTDGLGLASPAKPEKKDAMPPPPPVPAPAPPVRMAPTVEVFDMEPVAPVSAKTPASPPLAIPEEEEELQPTEKLAADKTFSALMEGPAPFPAVTARKYVETVVAPAPVASVPPPMPTSSFGRRVMAAFFDEALLLSLWAVALAITATVMEGTTAVTASDLAREFRSPFFLRFAALEFATLWLGYFALSLGLLDMTMGMWVWGLRVKYPGDGDHRFVRKVMRILLSFFFFAPLLPVVLLLPRWKGRNLLDFLSGTALYRVIG